MSLSPSLSPLVAELTATFADIPADRQALLQQLATYVRKQLTERGLCRLNFICTHNSRRSHLGQVWAATAATHYGLEGVTTYSGGTETTALNPRMAAAMQRAGFEVDTPDATVENPHYQIQFAPAAAVVNAWSKVYDDPANPDTEFAAIMTCDHADANCPFIPGAEWRLSLTYSDPKEADGTPRETAVYDERLREIGREILYAFSLVGSAD